MRAKPEVARGRFNVKRPAFGFWLPSVDLDAHGLSGGSRCGGDVVGRDSLRMGDEIAELPAAFCIAGQHGGAGGIVDIDIRPVAHRRDVHNLAGECCANDFLDRLPTRPVGPPVDLDDLRARLGGDLPDGPADPPAEDL